MPKLKPEEIQLRRREIVEAARRCFIRSGFHQTTTDEICREAAITPGGLYHYFANKEELIKAVIQHAADNAVSMVHEAATEAPDPRAALRKMGAFFVQAFYQPDFENIARLDLETWSEALRNPDLLKIIHAGRGAARNSIAEVIAEAVRRGDMNAKIDPIALANVFTAINTGLRLGRLLGPNEMDANAMMEALGILIRGELIPRPDNNQTAAPKAAERTAAAQTP